MYGGICTPESCPLLFLGTYIYTFNTIAKVKDASLCLYSLFPQLSEFIMVGRKRPAMVNIRVKKLNDTIKKNNLHQLQTIDADLLKDWI